MNNQQNPSAHGAKQPNDPSKNDPTKQDERENDATRIAPSKESGEVPKPVNGSSGSSDYNEAEKPISDKPYGGKPKHKPEQVEEPARKISDANNKGDYNIAEPKNKQNEPEEKDDEGNPVVKGFGRGL